MTQKLSSVLVTAEFDGAPYSRGANAVVDSNRRMAESGRAAGVAAAELDVTLSRSTRGMTALHRQNMEGYGSALQFYRGLKLIQGGLEEGQISLGRASSLYEGLTRTHQIYADAANIAARGNTQLAGAIDEVNARAAAQITVMNQVAETQRRVAQAAAMQTDISGRIGIGRPVYDAEGSAQVFADRFAKEDAEHARLRAAEIGRAFAEELNQRLVEGTEKSARDSAAVFQRELDEIDKIAQLKAEQAGKNFGDALRERLIAGTTKSARDSAAAFESEITRLEQVARQSQQDFNEILGVRAPEEMFGQAEESATSFGRAMDELTSKYAPAIALQKEYAEQQNEIAQAYEMGVFGATGSAEAQEGLSQALAMAEVRFNAANEGVKTYNLTLWQQRLVVQSLLVQSGLLSHQMGSLATAYLLLTANNSGVLRGLRDFAAQSLSTARSLAVSYGGYVALAAGIGTAVAALIRYQSIQRDVRRDLFGIGAASGASASDINVIGEQQSSLLGLSTVEATRMASTLAATGKIGADALGDIVAMGRDLAIVLGVDATKAAEELAKAFSDPVRGAEQLNERLGFLNARTRENVRWLVEQGDRQAAIRVLAEAVAPSLERATELTHFWARAWTAVSNAASSAFHDIGRAVDRVFNTGPLEQRLEGVQRQLEEARRPTGGVSQWTVGGGPELIRQLEEMERALAAQIRLRQSFEAIAGEDAAARQRSLAAQDIVNSVTTEIEERRKLEAQVKSLADAMADPRFAQNTENMERAAQAAARLSGAMETLMDPMERHARSHELALRAITARSPAEREQLAMAQRRLDLAGAQLTAEEREGQIRDAGIVARRQAEQALTDSQRARILGAQQSVAAQQLEIDLIGQSAGETARLRANFRAYWDLKREAAQNNTGLDRAQLERLKAINAEMAKLVQFTAEAGLSSRLQFERDTMFFSETDREIAQEMKNIYDTEWQSNMDSALAQQMRMNALMKGMADAVKQLGQDLLSALTQGGDVVGNITGALGRAGQRQASAGLDNLISMAAQPGGFSNWLNMGVGGSAAHWTGPVPGTGTFVPASPGLMSMHGALGMAGAGFAGFQAGQQSGSMLTGGLTGALGGALAGAAFGPVGMVVGGLLGGAGGLLGGSMGKAANDPAHQQRQAMARAQEAEMARLDGVIARLKFGPQATDTLEGQLALFDMEAGQRRAQTETQFQGHWSVLAKLDEVTELERAEVIRRFREQELERERQHQERLSALRESYEDRILRAETDASTLEGALALFDRAAQREREQVAKEMAEALPDLERALAAERFRIVDDFATRAIEAEQRRAEQVLRIADQIRSYLDSIQLGALSILSPAEQVAAAQQAYERQLELAQGGDQDALANITRAADPYLRALRDFHGPSEIYGDLFRRVMAELENLEAMAKVGKTLGALAPAPIPKEWPGYATGGVVGNGIWDRDSVLARYGRGGHIALAGGEGVLTAPATAAIGGANVIDFINRNRTLPTANDNSDVVAELRELRTEVAALRRENKMLMSGQISATAQVGAGVARVDNSLAGLRTDTRQATEERRVRQRSTAA